jgi:hypothetical protein
MVGRFRMNAPKQFSIEIISRKGLTREVNEIILTLTNKLEQLNKWKLPKRP